MSSGIASANPGPVNHGPAAERFDGSDATGPASAAESFTQFLEEEAEPQPTPKARKAAARERTREAADDGDGKGDEGQAQERQPKRERAKAPDTDADDDPLRDPILDRDDDADDEGDDEADEEGEDEDGDEDADENEDGEDDDGDDEDPEHDVTVNGVPQRVKLSELIQGYSREADYRQKTTALAADREEVETFATQVAERGQIFDRAIQTYQDLITAVMPSKAEWEALKSSNPEAYIAAQEQWGKFAEAMENSKAHREALQQQEAEENQRQHSDYVKQENRKLLEKLPQLSDKKVAKNFSAAIFGYGRKVGYSDEEMKAGLINHRDVMTAYYASRYLEILESRQANKAKTKGKAPRASEGNSNPRTVQTPKGRRAARNNREQRSADNRLARTGNLQDAGKAFAAMFRE